MCGIAGIWQLDNKKLLTHKLQKFTDSMAHRGPDGAGYFIDEEANLGLGHRRLSILDLSAAGKQPMAFADDRYHITFNGEIYNFIELRKELQKSGYTFKTETDTEVLLSAFHFWGKDCLYKFNGMWAFVIWDKQEQILFAARDRFGVKPLYYLHLESKLFAFASETIAFKYLDDFKRGTNNQNLLLSLLDSKRMEATGYTMFDNIKQLSSGCYMLVKKGKPIQQQRWWNTFEHLKQVPEKFQEQVDYFKFLFEDSCKLRLRSDVPIASALSGGVDSSAVYCMIHHLMQKEEIKDRTPVDWQKAFVATFPNTSQDERHFAEEVIKFTKGNARYIEPDYSNLVSDIISSTLKFDSITGTPISIVANVYKAMRQDGIIVSMDGHGADELMYGYRASVAENFYHASILGEDCLQEEILQTYLGMYYENDQQKAKTKLIQKAKEIGEFEKNQQKIIPSLKKKIRKIISSNNGNSLSALNTENWFNNSELENCHFQNINLPKFPNLSRGELKLASDFHQSEIPYNLRDFDRASMQHGIEIRMPFMDYRLVTFLFSLPQQSKLGKGYTKLILREAMKGLMPESIRTRKLKIGLSAPLANWFNDKLNSFILDEVHSTSFIQSPYWNGKLIKNFVEQKCQSKSWTDNEAVLFWNVLNAHIILSHAN